MIIRNDSVGLIAFMVGVTQIRRYLAVEPFVRWRKNALQTPGQGGFCTVPNGAEP